MKYCYWLKYNNYYNRVLKVDGTLSAYLGADNENVIHYQKDMNLWNPNDGITATVKAGSSTLSADFSVEPDYFICADENNHIDSRWFVIENRRLRKGQYLCVLKRDVFADDLQHFKEATCHISRGLLQKTNKLIFNDENLNVNQIISEETPLKDSVGCPWLVLYAATDIQSTHLSGSVSLGDQYDILYTATNDIQDFIDENTFYYVEGDKSIQATLNYEKVNVNPFASNTHHAIQFITDAQQLGPQLPYKLKTSSGLYPEYLTDTSKTANILSKIRTEYAIKTKSDYDNVSALNGKKVKYTDANNVDHIVQLKMEVTHLDYMDVRLASENDVFTALEEARALNGIFAGSSVAPQYYRIQARRSHVTFTPEDIPIATIDYSFNNNGYIPNDAPYIIWAIPYGEITIDYEGTEYVTSGDAALAVANRMLQENSSNALYDCQILPYCPLPDMYIDDGVITITTEDTNLTSKTTIYKDTTPYNFVFNVPQSSFARRCMLPTAVTIDDPKFRNTAEIYRIYSPNYNASFEFSAAKNEGVTGFNIRCTYMPFNPYIRVAPIWGGLYGSEGFEENVRGLICSGDYSIARVTDAWIQYQENNKNYEAIFNRQISNMDVMHRFDKIEKIAGLIGGTASSVSIGSIAGPAGAIVGGIGSAATGIADYALMEQRFSEQKQYSRDMYQLNLGNVQAMPRTISRTTAYTIDNRYFPVFVRYTCSSDEISALVQYFVENSFRVDVIGYPEQFMNRDYYILNTTRCRGFLQGQIIRIDTDKDTHYIQELNNEFSKGVYMR